MHLKRFRVQSSFASLFQDNRNPRKGITLYKVDNQDEVVEVDYEEVDGIIVTWGFSLVIYIAGGFAGIDAITKLRST